MHWDSLLRKNVPNQSKFRYIFLRLGGYIFAIRIIIILHIDLPGIHQNLKYIIIVFATDFRLEASRNYERLRIVWYLNCICHNMLLHCI